MAQVLIRLGLNLCLEKRKEKLEPNESCQFGKTGGFSFGHSDQNRNNFIDGLLSHVLLKFALVELFVHLSLKVVETFLGAFSEIFFFVSKHEKEIFQDLRQVWQEINSDDLIEIGNPLYEKLPDTGAHGLDLNLNYPHEFLDVEFFMNDFRSRTES